MTDSPMGWDCVEGGAEDDTGLRCVDCGAPMKWEGDLIHNVCEDCTPNRLELLCDSHYGIYVPQVWVTKRLPGFEAQWGLDDEDMAENLQILRDGPDHDQYWDAWQEVLDNASMTDEKGRTWGLCQDGDLWAVCYPD